MGDHPAGTGGHATPPTGKRVARHAAEQSLGQPYAGRRVARPAPTVPSAPVAAVAPVADRPVSLAAPGRRRRTDVAPDSPVASAPHGDVTPFAPRPVGGRRL